MDYALAKSLCSIGVKPASFRSIMQQDVSLSSKGLNANVQPSKNSLGKSIILFAMIMFIIFYRIYRNCRSVRGLLFAFLRLLYFNLPHPFLTLSKSCYVMNTDFAESARQTGRLNTPVSSSSTSSSSRPLGSDQGMKGSRGTESSSGKEQQSTRTGSVDANGVSRQQGQSRLPDKNGVSVSSGASRAAPLPPYPKTGSRSQPQPPPSNPPYNQQQYGHGQGQGQDCNYLSPNQQQQRSYQNNPSASYNDCYNYNRSNPSQRTNSDNPNVHGQSHHLEEGRPRPPQGPPKGPGRGPQPPLPPVPAPPTR